MNIETGTAHRKIPVWGRHGDHAKSLGVIVMDSGRVDLLVEDWAILIPVHDDGQCGGGHIVGISRVVGLNQQLKWRLQLSWAPLSSVMRC